MIRPEQEAHTYDEDYTAVIGDWYHDQHAVLMDEFFSIANPGGAEPAPGEYVPIFLSIYTLAGR